MDSPSLHLKTIAMKEIFSYTSNGVVAEYYVDFEAGFFRAIVLWNPLCDLWGLDA